MSFKPRFRPDPGEAWVLTSDGRYKPPLDDGSYHEDFVASVYMPRNVPFVVTSLTVDRVYVTYAVSEGAKTTWIVLQDGLEWLEHFRRIWPPVPNWEELEARYG